MDTKKTVANYCIRIADDHLIQAQRLAELCSYGPILEEDLAMTNISLDCFGQAEFFYDYAVELLADGRTADAIAFRRSERQYTNHLLVEQPNGDFAMTMMRVFLYSAFSKLWFEALVHSNDERLAALAAKALKEAKYHLRHSSEWVIRLGNGTDESLNRCQGALIALWPFTDNLFASNEVDAHLMELGIACDMAQLRGLWDLSVKEVLADANLLFPEKVHMQKGGIDGMHSEHLGHLLCEMQFLQRAYPDAKW
jgi:ring-1,2-phenylacetyl-CoA epoxidase subunit PaaC